MRFVKKLGLLSLGIISLGLAVFGIPQQGSAADK